LQPTLIDSRRSYVSTDVDAHAGEARTEAHADFARGQRRDSSGDHVYGDFATGMRSLAMLSVTGDFATGMRIARRQTIVGDFATGMRTLTTPVAAHHFANAERELTIAA
jgi:hypothetical protein